MLRTANKACLQKPHPQTPQKNDNYWPHIRVKSATYNQADPDSKKEGRYKLQQWLYRDEQEIERKLQGKAEITRSA